MNVFSLHFGCCLLLVLLTVGCSKSTNNSEQQLSEKEAKKEPDATVLAIVNGENITENDVIYRVEKSVADAELALKSSAVKENVLQSLIAAKAMKQLALAEMPAQELAQIKAQVENYREELLVKEYLKKNISPAPITHKMISDYYHSHLVEFGQTESKIVELLKPTKNVNENERDIIVATLNALSANKDWEVSLANGSTTADIAYSKVRFYPGLFDKAVETAINTLEVGATSDIIFVKDEPTMIRVLSKEQLPAKPLSDVSAEIRARLSAIELKNAIKKSSEEAVEKIDVTIPIH